MYSKIFTITLFSRTQTTLSCALLNNWGNS